MPIKTPESEPIEWGILRPWRLYPKLTPTTRFGPFPSLKRIGTKRRPQSSVMSWLFSSNWSTSNSTSINSRNRSSFCKAVWTKPLRPQANRPHPIRLSKGPNAPNGESQQENVEAERDIQVPVPSCLSRLMCNTSIRRRVPVDMASGEFRRLTTPIRGSSCRLSPCRSPTSCYTKPDVWAVAG